MIRTLTDTALIHHINEVYGPLYRCPYYVDSDNFIMSYIVYIGMGT